MSLNEYTINTESLKRWVKSLNVDNIQSIDIGGDCYEIKDEMKNVLETQLRCFSECINKMRDGDDWKKYRGILSDVFYNAFIRVDNSSIRIGDYYECMIEPGNVKTYKDIIKGFKNIETGSICVSDSTKNPVAFIGQKSDLIWNVFYDYFINDNDDGSIDHVYSNHDRYLSIQLFNVEHLTLEEIHSRVNEILLYVSMKYGMDFKVFKVEPLIKQEGNNPVLTTEYSPMGFEEIPMFYLMNANNTEDVRFKYLSYYQVIEYFFVRAQNYFIIGDLKNIDWNNVNHNELRKVLNAYKNKLNERESLKLVLKCAVDVTKFKTWLTSNSDFVDSYCNSQKHSININNDDSIITNIANRIYDYRCSIAHAKGDVEEYIAIPSVSNKIIEREIPLIKYLAYEVIKNCSEV